MPKVKKNVVSRKKMFKCKDDDKAEIVLAQLNLEWGVEEVSLSEIDWAFCKDNCGRLSGVDQLVVAEYATAKRAGDIFPMSVLGLMPNKRYGFASGTHRGLAEKEAGATHTIAYVVPIQDEGLFRVIAGACNSREGVRLAEEDRRELAVHLIMNHNYNVKEICKTLKVGESGVRAKKRVVEMRDLLKRCGYSGRSLKDYQLSPLLSLKHNIKVLTSVAEQVSSFNLPGTETRELVKCVKAKEDEAAKLAVVVKEASKLSVLRDGAGSGVSVPLRGRFIRAMHTVEGYVRGVKKATELGINKGDKDYEEVRESVVNTARTIISLLA